MYISKKKNEMNISEKTILSSSNNNLTLIIRTPVFAPKGIIQINTGTCIPQKIYWKFADYLCQNGYVAITYDYGNSENFSSSVKHEEWLKDMECVSQFVLENYSNQKKYIVGHSSGGQLIGYTPSAALFDKLFLVASTNGYIGYLPFYMRIVLFLFWKIIVSYSLWKYGYMNNEAFGTKGGFPKNIILELRQWCLTKDFFVSYFKTTGIQSHYNSIKITVKSYHLADDKITTSDGCQFILDLYSNAQKEIETLHANDYGIKKFGHRGFFFASAEKKLWPKFLKDLEK